MNRPFTILITDRNRHVREFLRREMMAEGYHVRLAKNGKEVLKWAHNHEPLDLLILDLELPDVSELALLDKLQKNIPALPVVVHSFLSEYVGHPTALSTATFVEKKGTNIDGLKKAVFELLRKCHPQRFELRENMQGGSAK